MCSCDVYAENWPPNDSIVLAISSDDRFLATSSNDHSAKIRNAETGKEFLGLWGHENVVFRAAFSHEERRVITGSYDGNAKIWDAGTGEELVALKAQAGIVVSVVFSMDGRRALTVGHDHTVNFWDAVDWSLIKEEYPEHQRQCYEEWLKANVSYHE